MESLTSTWCPCWASNCGTREEEAKLWQGFVGTCDRPVTLVTLPPPLAFVHFKDGFWNFDVYTLRIFEGLSFRGRAVSPLWFYVIFCFEQQGDIPVAPYCSTLIYCMHTQSAHFHPLPAPHVWLTEGTIYIYINICTVYILFDEMKTDEPGEMERLTLQISVIKIIPIWDGLFQTRKRIKHPRNSSARKICKYQSYSYRCHPKSSKMVKLQIPSLWVFGFDTYACFQTILIDPKTSGKKNSWSIMFWRVYHQTYVEPS